MTEAESTHDFIVIDTPGSDSYLMRLAHSMADTLITPLNDSFVDFDVLGSVDPTTFEVGRVSHYAEMVRDARRQRRLVDGGLIDWVVLRNRLSALGSRNKRLVGEGVDRLAGQLGFRSADGFIERVIYREFFPRGLTALDEIGGDTLGLRPSFLARLGARRGQGADGGAKASARSAWQTPRRGARRMDRVGRQAARDPRPACR